MHHCVFMHRRISLLHYDGIDVYTMNQENDRYNYYNGATVAIPKRVFDINNYQRMLDRQERGPGGVLTDYKVHIRMCGPCVEQ